MWIDAICLNQKDDNEKAIHVPFMGKVYSNAARTLIWLGEADSTDSDLAVDNIETLTQKLLNVKNPKTLSIQQRLTENDLPLPEDQIWEAIKILQLRPWFFRLWTLQEIVLSKDAILMCGHKSLPWNSLVALHEASIQAELSTMVNTAADPETPLNDTQALIRSADFLRKLRKMGGNRTLPMLLTLSADRGYSLPVDRVWALIGMLNGRYQRIIRDECLVRYDEDAITNYHETFMRIARFHVKYDTYLAMQIIDVNDKIDKPKTVRNPLLPSWCPDWHTGKGVVPLAHMVEALVGLPGGEFRRIEPFMKINDDCSLELCGLEVDTIECVTTSPGRSMMDLDRYQWLTECLDIMKSATFFPYDVYPAQAKIPAISSTREDGSPIPSQLQGYTQAEEVLKYVLYPPGLLKASPRSLLPCSGRKFFRTKAGRLGFGPAALQENDLLCAMYGARSLWALRPYDAAEETRELQSSDSCLKTSSEDFELLGSAYTPSLLSGEAWTGTSCEAMRRFKIR